MHDTGSEPILIAKTGAEIAVEGLARIERNPLARETGYEQQAKDNPPAFRQLLAVAAAILR
jgi:hypothetical protein